MTEDANGTMETKRDLHRPESPLPGVCEQSGACPVQQPSVLATSSQSPLAVRCSV